MLYCSAAAWQAETAKARSLGWSRHHAAWPRTNRKKRAMPEPSRTDVPTYIVLRSSAFTRATARPTHGPDRLFDRPPTSLCTAPDKLRRPIRTTIPTLIFQDGHRAHEHALFTRNERTHVPRRLAFSGSSRSKLHTPTLIDCNKSTAMSYTPTTTTIHSVRLGSRCTSCRRASVYGQHQLLHTTVNRDTQGCLPDCI